MNPNFYFLLVNCLIPTFNFHFWRIVYSMRNHFKPFNIFPLSCLLTSSFLPHLVFPNVLLCPILFFCAIFLSPLSCFLRHLVFYAILFSTPSCFSTILFSTPSSFLSHLFCLRLRHNDFLIVLFNLYIVIYWFFR